MQPEEDDLGKILQPDGRMKAKGAGILHPTASNNNKNGPYKAKKSMATIVKQKQQRDARQRMFLEEQEEL